MTEEKIAIALYSINKYAKKIRDYLKSTNYWTYDADEKQEEKEYLYWLKSEVLKRFTPTEINYFEDTFERNIRVYEGEPEYKRLKGPIRKDWDNPLYIPKKFKVKQVKETVTRYFLIYYLSTFSYHVPIDDTSKYKDLKMKQVAPFYISSKIEGRSFPKKEAVKILKEFLKNNPA